MPDLGDPKGYGRAVATRYTKGERTQRAFLDAAEAEFAERGYLSTKVEDIARSAGKSPASFYNYFVDKAEVLTVLAQEFQEDTQTRISAPYKAGSTHREAIWQAIQIFWETYSQRLGALSGVFQASMVDEAFLESWRQIRGTALQFIRRGIEQAQADGYCPGVDPALTASALSSMLEHFCYVWFVQGGDGGRRKKVTTRQAVDTLASVWYHAVYWRD
jgi:AcrR family transcriptional regulator